MSHIKHLQILNWLDYSSNGKAQYEICFTVTGSSLEHSEQS